MSQNSTPTSRQELAETLDAFLEGAFKELYEAANDPFENIISTGKVLIYAGLGKAHGTNNPPFQRPAEGACAEADVRLLLRVRTIFGYTLPGSLYRIP